MRQMLYPQSYLHSIPMKRELLRWDSNPQHEADALPTELLTDYTSQGTYLLETFDVHKLTLYMNCILQTYWIFIESIIININFIYLQQSGTAHFSLGLVVMAIQITNVCGSINYTVCAEHCTTNGVL